MLDRSALHDWSFSASAEWVVGILLAFTVATTVAFVLAA